MIFNDISVGAIRDKINKTIKTGILNSFCGLLMITIGFVFSGIEFIVAAGIVIFGFGTFNIIFFTLLMIYGEIPKILKFLVGDPDKIVSGDELTGIIYMAEEGFFFGERARKHILSKNINKITNFDLVNMVIMDLSEKVNKRVYG